MKKLFFGRGRCACKTFRLCNYLGILLFCLSAFLFPAYLRAETASLTILHTNDTHGHLLPFSYPKAVRGKEAAELKIHENIGGIARRATLIKRLRKELTRNGTTVWVVDAGDFADGSPFSIEYQGAADAAAMNAAGYTLGTLGNHEFNYSLSRLKEVIRLFKYPILCANAVESETGNPLTKEYEILKVGPVRIGVFGLLTHSAASYPAAKEGVKITGEITAARRMVQKLRPQADIIILISHCGEEVDKNIAENVPGIAAIVGGHSHSRLPFGKVVWGSQSGISREGEGTILVQAHQWGGELGRLDLVFEKNADGSWRVARHKASLIAVTPDIAEDPETTAVVNRYWKPIAARYNQVIGQAAADFVDHGDDLTAYNLMTDALRETFQVELALENMGGVRAPLKKGDITFDDLAEMDPFDNTVVKFSIRGSRLRKILTTRRPAVSGITYRVENNVLTAAAVGGKPLDDGKTYTGVTNSYFARTSLGGVKIEDTGKQRLDVLAEYIRKKGTVRPIRDARRVIRRQG